jgi:hypothetical protein
MFFLESSNYKLFRKKNIKYEKNYFKIYLFNFFDIFFNKTWLYTIFKLLGANESKNKLKILIIFKLKLFL